MKTDAATTWFSHPFAGLSKIGPRLTFLAALGFLLAMTMAMFGPVLFSSEEIVISKPHTDLFDQFAYWRQFGFDTLRQGNLALWNPHVFSGAKTGSESDLRQQWEEIKAMEKTDRFRPADPGHKDP